MAWQAPLGKSYLSLHCLDGVCSVASRQGQGHPALREPPARLFRGRDVPASREPMLHSAPPSAATNWDGARVVCFWKLCGCEV